MVAELAAIAFLVLWVPAIWTVNALLDWWTDVDVAWHRRLWLAEHHLLRAASSRRVTAARRGSADPDGEPQPTPERRDSGVGLTPQVVNGTTRTTVDNLVRDAGVGAQPAPASPGRRAADTCPGGGTAQPPTGEHPPAGREEIPADGEAGGVPSAGTTKTHGVAISCDRPTPRTAVQRPPSLESRAPAPMANDPLGRDAGRDGTPLPASPEQPVAVVPPDSAAAGNQPARMA